jgi:hypothetical protein
VETENPHACATVNCKLCNQQQPCINCNKYETVHRLFTDFKKAYDSVKREVLYKILIEFGIPMKLVRLIKMCLNKSKIRQCKHLSDKFTIQNGLKGVLYRHSFSTLL